MRLGLFDLITFTFFVVISQKVQFRVPLFQISINDTPSVVDHFKTSLLADYTAVFRSLNGIIEINPS